MYARMARLNSTRKAQSSFGTSGAEHWCNEARLVKLNEFYFVFEIDLSSRIIKLEVEINDQMESQVLYESLNLANAFQVCFWYSALSVWPIE